MKQFYVSLARDLIHCYIRFNAESEEAVRAYLAQEYRTEDGTWKLPWCSIYDKVPDIDRHYAIVIDAKCGDLFNDDYGIAIVKDIL